MNLKWNLPISGRIGAEVVDTGRSQRRGTVNLSDLALHQWRHHHRKWKDSFFQHSWLKTSWLKMKDSFSQHSFSSLCLFDLNFTVWRHFSQLIDWFRCFVLSAIQPLISLIFTNWMSLFVCLLSMLKRKMPVLSNLEQWNKYTLVENIQILTPSDSK